MSNCGHNPNSEWHTFVLIGFQIQCQRKKRFNVWPKKGTPSANLLSWVLRLATSSQHDPKRSAARVACCDSTRACGATPHSTQSVFLNGFCRSWATRKRKVQQCIQLLCYMKRWKSAVWDASNRMTHAGRVGCHKLSRDSSGERGKPPYRTWHHGAQALWVSCIAQAWSCIHFRWMHPGKLQVSREFKYLVMLKGNCV